MGEQGKSFDGSKRLNQNRRNGHCSSLLLLNHQHEKTPSTPELAFHLISTPQGPTLRLPPPVSDNPISGQDPADTRQVCEPSPLEGREDLSASPHAQLCLLLQQRFPPPRNVSGGRWRRGSAELHGCDGVGEGSGEVAERAEAEAVDTGEGEARDGEEAAVVPGAGGVRRREAKEPEL